MAGMKTTAEIAELLGENVNRVRRIINYHSVEPSARASTIKLFDDVKVERIRGLMFNMRIQRT